MISLAPAGPVLQVRDSMTEPKLKITNPRLYILTRPNMSPMRPTVTTSTACTREYPMRIQRRYAALPAARGSSLMPLKMAGSEIIVLDPFMDAMSIPNVVLDRATHL